ncbi:hypothetical protein LX32DRAFT_643822 [Colletotrichum zoysiae]|uniref:Uncharacterized protein n=1 Tax=Colletotrichum zoysiae TaxID=1216348 RepID=A0AAD9LX98_9PEZI|nr:hypothetical protein LX32DRAFT_643822 [Colletotrichum zoysiae]
MAKTRKQMEKWLADEWDLMTVGPPPPDNRSIHGMTRRRVAAPVIEISNPREAGPLRRKEKRTQQNKGVLAAGMVNALGFCGLIRPKSYDAASTAIADESRERARLNPEKECRACAESTLHPARGGDRVSGPHRCWQGIEGSGGRRRGAERIKSQMDKTNCIKEKPSIDSGAAAGPKGQGNVDIFIDIQGLRRRGKGVRHSVASTQEAREGGEKQSRRGTVSIDSISFQFHDPCEITVPWYRRPEPFLPL